ncbi:FecCD family ABC transporter permease [Acetonema longum]|uniref:Transporter permease n=1 Tax=Acetonema longum DSM 6540 TaxID=1009370 RepID=F7NPS9_9FIRM|nr:iron ABC transporter permease [Acetonema longum]EGO61920.1 transporter permease [Acetonema longum DSM 6540]
MENNRKPWRQEWQRGREKRLWRLLCLILLLFLAAAGLIISLARGAMDISAGEIIAILSSGLIEDAKAQVIWNIRLPRTLVGALVGMNLALAGGVLQGVMKNPLADPHIIGISAGAGLAGVSVLILFPHMEYLVVPVAFLGAMGAAALIYILAWKGGIQPMRIVLAGVAVSAFLGAGISALLVFYSDRVHGALMWMVGGLSARSWPHVSIISPYTLLAGSLALLGARRLNLLVLGDDVARGLGLPVEQTRLFLTAVAALLAASAVSVVGLLGFVGLIVPHTARLLIGSDFRYLLPASALLGASVVTLSDTVARTLFAPVEIPVGIIMAFLGAPFFLYLLRRG